MNRNGVEHFIEIIVNVEGARKYGVHVPPLSAYGVLVVSPAEHALVGAG